jgi:stress response protein YsnF
MKNRCNKESFVDKDAADKVLAIYNEKYKNKKDFALLTNSYECFHCGTWHLTSKPNYQTKLKKVEIELFITKKKLESREAELTKRIHTEKKLISEIANLKRILALKKESKDGRET